LINIEPIGVVHNDFIDPKEIKVGTGQSTIEIFPQYTDALLRINEHSHIWVLGWFHKAEPGLLRVVPRLNKDLPEYGVFGLRTYSRPNPIGLTVVRLDDVKDNLLTVNGLDFIDGTPIIDIKPYYEQDIVFSPGTPYIKPKDAAMVEQIMMKEAIKHHQEECDQMFLAVKMGVAAERVLGRLTARDLKITVIGSNCLADTIQGITRARLANPRRFYFQESDIKSETRWEKDNKTVVIRLKKDAVINDIKDRSYEEILDIEIQ